MGHETYINRRSALKSFNVYLDQIGLAGGVGIPLEDVTRPMVVATGTSASPRARRPER